MAEADSKPMRLFFGLWPDEQVRRSLRKLQRLPGPSAGRRVHPEDIHLTLAFLGQVEPGRLPCLEAAAAGVTVDPFEMNLIQLGQWKGPRVSWVAPEETPPGLTALVDQLWSGLADCGFEREARPFRPHITLSRKTPAFSRIELPEAIPWEAHDFVLVCSLSVPEPPRYKVLRRWPLQKVEMQG